MTSKLPINPHAKARARVGKLVSTKPSKVVNSQSYETDINNMVRGLTPFTQSRRQSFYIDETNLPLNYEEQFNSVLAAQAAFMQLPPDVREKFSNDPAKLAIALGDPRRIEELQRLGVISSPAKPEPPSKGAPAAAKAAQGSGGREPPQSGQAGDDTND